MAAENCLRITVNWSPGPREVHEECLQLPVGATVLQAVRACTLNAILGESCGTGIWGKTVEGAHVLQDGDRLELYRPLRVDPKEARRSRFEAQGARTAGLFANKRAGAKAGY